MQAWRMSMLASMTKHTKFMLAPRKRLNRSSNRSRSVKFHISGGRIPERRPRRANPSCGLLLFSMCSRYPSISRVNSLNVFTINRNRIDVLEWGIHEEARLILRCVLRKVEVSAFIKDRERVKQKVSSKLRFPIFRLIPVFRLILFVTTMSHPINAPR